MTDAELIAKLKAEIWRLRETLFAKVAGPEWMAQQGNSCRGFGVFRDEWDVETERLCRGEGT